MQAGTRSSTVSQIFKKNLKSIFIRNDASSYRVFDAMFKTSFRYCDMQIDRNDIMISSDYRLEIPSLLAAHLALRRRYTMPKASRPRFRMHYHPVFSSEAAQQPTQPPRRHTTATTSSVTGTDLVPTSPGMIDIARRSLSG